MSAVKTLIIFENLTVERIELEHPVSNERNVHYVKPGDESKKNIYVDPETGSLFSTSMFLLRLTMFPNRYIPT